MDHSKSGVRPSPDVAEFIIGPAHRVRPLAGPMAGSGRTRWLHPGYGLGTAATFAPLTFKERTSYGIADFRSRLSLREGLAQPSGASLRSGDIGCWRNHRSCQEGLDFKDANIDHVSIHVADLQRSVDFYQKMFGFSVVSQDQPGGIIRLGNAKVLVSLNHGSPAGIVDHFAIGIPRFSRESAARYLTQRGATPLEGDYAGLHVKDPDGINVQISQK